MEIPASAIVSAEFVESPHPDSRAVVPTWGISLVPHAGSTLAALSSGKARTPSMPGYVGGNGTAWGAGPFSIPLQPNVPACPSGQPYDVTELRIELVIPAGATGFSFDHNFLANDYPEWVCTVYNDGFVALAESPALGSVNVAFDSVGNPTVLNTALFLAAAGAPLGTAPLQGTGYENGGATMWNTASVPAAAGTTVVLRLFIYDGGDGIGDSSVLLDNFQWLTSSSQAPVANAGADQTVVGALTGTASGTLDGTQSSDPDGGALTYAWSGAFGTATGATPTVTLPVGVHVITLTVTDPVGASASDTVTVTVLDGNAALQSTIAALQASVAAHDGSIAALQASVTSHDGSIAALQASVAALQGAVTTLQATIAGLEARLAAAESRNVDLEAQVLTLQRLLQEIRQHPIWNSLPRAGARGR